MTRYALVIGISQYEEPFEILSKAITDATAVKALLEQSNRFQNIELLIGEVTKANLVGRLTTFLQQKADRNEALIYFTGHGFIVVNDMGISEGYLATSNCQVIIENNRIIAQQEGLLLQTLDEIIRNSNLSNLVVLLDSCHSGDFIEQNIVDQSLEVFNSNTDYYLIAACRGFEKTFAKKREQHSVFTRALLKGLSQENADDLGKITCDRLFDSISRNLQGRNQEPIRLGRGRAIVLLEYTPQMVPKRLGPQLLNQEQLISLTKEWFASHLSAVRSTAGTRYTPDLNVKTDLWKWFSAFSRTVSWFNTLKQKVQLCRKGYSSFASAVQENNSRVGTPEWTENSHRDAEALLPNIQTLVDAINNLGNTDDLDTYKGCTGQLKELLSNLAHLENRLSSELESQYGAGRANSPSFRQFMAEYMLTLPAANLDRTREVIKAFKDLHEWLESPAGSLAFTHAFVLTGVAGSGKTHGICDVAHYRFDIGLLTCVTFGHLFRGEPDPWTRLLESLGLPLTLGMNGLLDTLNSAAEASGSLLILCIDAINETRPLRYWRDRLAAILEAVQRRPFLRFCITCRTSFTQHCLPDNHNLPIIEHLGFAGVERDACKSFFLHYNLEPPISPILQPELSNPLYLKLVCETLQTRGLNRLPSGWFGLAPAITAFIEAKEQQFAEEHETSANSNIIGGSLRAIAREIVASNDSALTLSRAQQIVSQERPQARNLPVLDWLVRADLLIEDAPITNDPLGSESTVRPAFERLGDFLIAKEHLVRVTTGDLASSFQPSGNLYSLLANSTAIEQNNGVISALSILIPEKFPGKELPNLIDDSVRETVLKIVVESFPWRTPSSFSLASASLMYEAFEVDRFFGKAMDAALSICWQPSEIDALWLNDFLKRYPLTQRDAAWCVFLHIQYELPGSVRRLIDAAFELPLNQVETEIAERWATALLWFTAASDRRVKDKATQAATAILSTLPEIIPNILTRMLDSNDDEIRERSLLSCYGALIISQSTEVVHAVTILVYEAFQSDPTRFNNAIIRDHIRCIAELANELAVLPEEYDPELTLQPISSGWRLDLPSEQEIQLWKGLPKLVRSCLDDDFFFYSINCLRSWHHAVSKQGTGKWILKQVAHELGYAGSKCEQFDEYMLGKYGDGRSTPAWAERIGKKYQWIALYELASHLHDTIERKRERWDPELQRTPLILLEERKLDPTLPPSVMGDFAETKTWWISASVDFESTEYLSELEWVHKEDDLPSLEGLLKVVEHDEQRWRLLASNLAWRARDEDPDWNSPYREVGVYIHSYLIREEEIDMAYTCLHRRNFFGRWLSEGASWLYGFVGEYPWATSFNTEPEEYHMQGGSEDLPFVCVPSWNQIAVEWEYDGSLPQSLYMYVPSRFLFEPNDLWWDGRDGYRINNGRTVLRDPSITEVGPSALVADAGDLLERLNKIRGCLIWTLLGEKWILGGEHNEPTPKRTFSQIAQLQKDGSLKLGERVFFEDYNQDIELEAESK